VYYINLSKKHPGGVIELYYHLCPIDAIVKPNKNPATFSISALLDFLLPNPRGLEVY